MSASVHAATVKFRYAGTALRRMGRPRESRNGGLPNLEFLRKKADQGFQNCGWLQAETEWDSPLILNYIQHYIQLFNFWITVGRRPTLTRLSQRLTLREPAAEAKGTRGQGGLPGLPGHSSGRKPTHWAHLGLG